MAGLVAGSAIGLAWWRRSRDHSRTGQAAPPSKPSAPQPVKQAKSPTRPAPVTPTDAPATTEPAPAPPTSAPSTAVQPPALPPTAAIDAPEASGSRLARLRSRIRGGLGEALASVFRTAALTDDDWDLLEETLLLADVGAGATDELLTGLRARLKANPGLTPREALRAELLVVVDPARDRSLQLGSPGDGAVATAVVVGVNGVGKTTTVAKLARVLVADGHTVMLGAADTFRAAAADQLQTWGARVGVPVVRADREGADPASVAFTAASAAVEAATDVLLIDTAGRLQNKQGLMDELGKIVRVLSKVREPSEVLLVLDATTGQNGLAQAKVFGEVAPLTGIVLTKLDGTAKGGIVIAVQRELGVPVKFIGLGEGPDDLAPFDAEQFVDSLLGE
ncbi:MAG: signal recognition particle-docking protein FtsY [Actinobacteria bacterium HGW-Actinobacteria-4]|nr:MAG: signal recognition particle-docking protein FtsY [Actinobacteria bacterium HGW-Actinobacteria-4]